MASRVIVWTASAALLKKIDDALSELAPARPTFGRGGTEARRGFEVVRPTGYNDRPDRAAFVVTSGSAKTAERFAWSLGAQPLVLPEAAAYLIEQCKRAEPGDPLVLVGFDLRPTKA